MEGVHLPIEGGDVGAAFQGAGARAGQVFAHPAASVTDTVEQWGTGSGLSCPSLCRTQPWPQDSPLLAAIGDLLTRCVQVFVQPAVALAHRNAAAAPDVVIHGAWDSQGGDVTPARPPTRSHHWSPAPTPVVPTWSLGWGLAMGAQPPGHLPAPDNRAPPKGLQAPGQGPGRGKSIPRVMTRKAAPFSASLKPPFGKGLTPRPLLPGPAPGIGWREKHFCAATAPTT